MKWTRRETLVFLVFSTLPPLLATVGVDVGIMPWQPIAVLGTAVAFMTGFKSNAAYGRLWEARKIWGAIVNASRSWGILVRDFVAEEPLEDTHRRLILRHVAWMTALRYQLRQSRAWETTHLRHNTEYQARTFTVPEQTVKLKDELAFLVSSEELTLALSKKNRATAFLALQSEDVRIANGDGRLSEYRQVELTRLISILIEQQGKCERIKNFPYPRQFATLNRIFVWLFIGFLPFGVAAILHQPGTLRVWFTVPITLVVAWVFHTMDKIGNASENPFESGPNDVPISAMSRGIEIDLRDLLNEPDLPEPLMPTHNILM